MKTQSAIRSIVASAGIGLFAWAANAQGSPTWDDVGPIFAENCTGCHFEGGRAGLNLTSYATALAGSNNGPVLVAGDPNGSLLVQRITGQVTPQMPRGRAPLSQEQIDLIIAWIAGGLAE